MVGFSPVKKPRKKPTRGQLLVRNVKQRFKRIDTLNSAVELIEQAGPIHSHYFHYTTVDSVKKMIKSRRWWLTRADSLMFDDLIHQCKFVNRISFICAASSAASPSERTTMLAVSPSRYTTQSSKPCAFMSDSILLSLSESCERFTASIV